MLQRLLTFSPGYQAVLNELFRVTGELHTRPGQTYSHALSFLWGSTVLIFFPTANSSSEIQVLSTEHGIILHSTVTYYHEDQRVGWLHKCVKLATITHTFGAVKITIQMKMCVKKQTPICRHWVDSTSFKVR